MLKKFGEKITKKGLLIAGGIAIALVAIIIAIAIVLSKGEVTKKNSFIPDSELARAMTYDQVADGDEDTNSDFVKFDVFFLRDLNQDGIAEGVRGTCKEVGNKDTIYMELKVLSNGYLKDAQITVDNQNFFLETKLPKDDQIKENIIGDNINKIDFNQINNGTQKTITGMIKSERWDNENGTISAIGDDTTKYSGINSVTLTGTHVADDGTETKINKTIKFNIDWYGVTQAEIASYIDDVNYKNQEKDFSSINIDEANGKISFSFDVVTRETKNELIISKNSLEGTIPQLNNEDPLNVSVIGNAVTYTYSTSTRKFKAERNAALDNVGKVTKNGYSDEYNGDRISRYRVYVEYPIDAYKSLNGDTVELKVPVSAYYEGYNNKNNEFKNPYKSDIVQDTIVINFKNPTGNVAIFDVTVGDYVREPYYRYVVSKKNPLEVYNGVSSATNSDKYVIAWKGSTGTGNTGEKMVMKDAKIGEEGITDQFIKKDSCFESMENFVTNYGICFSNPVYLLGDNGWIKVYNDESNELLATFDSSNWNKYSITYPYSYNIPAKHIRIETSETKENQSLIVYNIKNINDEYLCNTYTREQFNEFIYIKSTLSGYMGDNYINTDINQANYEEPISIANVSASPTSMSTQSTEKNVKISVKSKVNEVYNEEKWANGIFLIKLPSTIIDTDINSVISNVTNNKVISFDKYVENDIQFIKIITENTVNDNVDLIIDLNLTADPRIQTTTGLIELYAINENCENYYSKSQDVYDIDNDSNTDEFVNYDSAYLNLISPNSLLTSEIARDYNDNNESVVAPQIAVINKETNSAIIELNIKNNYTSTISEVILLGRIPFEGNKYIVQGSELGSNFTTNMSNAGIQIPDDLKQYAKVYYSEKEEATRDLKDLNNDWTENPSDFSKVKSYLITLGEYQIPQNVSYTFSYSINIPNGLDYNRVSYSHHAVYFSLDTDAGKYRTYTEPNKLGFMIAKQYNLKVTKYQTDTNKTISGAIYSLNENGITNDTRTRTTDNNGKFNINNIYAEKEYVLKEVKSPSQYALSLKEIKFKVEINDDGELVPVLVSENLRKNTELIISKDENDNYELQVQVEDDVRPNLKIVKTEKDTDNRIANIKFRITGNGLPSEGKILTTNQNGEVDVTGLYLNSSYSLNEISNDGYIRTFNINFTITKVGENYRVDISKGIIKNQSIEIKNDIPEITLNIENERSPSFTLDITKTKKGDSSFAIAGAKFQLYRNNKLVGNYISDENGKIVIE